MPPTLRNDTPIETLGEEKAIYEGFLFSLIIKGLISLNEVISGIALIFIPSALLISWTNWEVSLLPHMQPFTLISKLLVSQLQDLNSGTIRFLSIYLLSRGLVKVFLIWALLKKQLWAYPWSLVVLGGFVVYQLYQIYTTHSILVSAITIFDLIVMYFIWREYKIVRAHVKA